MSNEFQQCVIKFRTVNMSVIYYELILTFYSGEFLLCVTFSGYSPSVTVVNHVQQRIRVRNLVQCANICETKTVHRSRKVKHYVASIILSTLDKTFWLKIKNKIIKYYQIFVMVFVIFFVIFFIQLSHYRIC